MIIKQLEMQRFGKFKDTVITLKDGLMPLCQANETGKTTMADFIRFMFYGFEKSKAKRTLGENLLIRYQPWDSAEGLAGAIEFSDEAGKGYRIERSVSVKGKNTARVMDADGKAVDTDAPGEYFLGVDAETFVNVFYIAQGNRTSRRTAGMDVAMKNLVTTGSEDISYDQVMEKLEKQRLRYTSRTGSGGKIKSLQNEIEETERFIALESARLSAAPADTTQQSRQRLAQIDIELRKTEDALRVHDTYRAYLRQQKREQQTAEDSLSESTIRELEEMFAGRRRHAQNVEQKRQNANMLQAQLTELSHREQTALQYRKEVNFPRGALWGIVMGILLIIAGIVGAVWHMVSLIISVVGITVTAGAVCAGLRLPRELLSAGIRNRKELTAAVQMALWQQDNMQRQRALYETALSEWKTAETQAEDWEQKYRVLCETTGVRTPEELEQYTRNGAALQLAAERLRDARTRLAELRDSEEKDREIADPTLPDGEEETWRGREKELVREREELLRHMAEHAAEHRALKTRREQLGEMSASLEQKRAELAAAQSAHEIVCIAMETMEQAQSALRDNYAPLLRAAMEKNLSMLTDGKYDTVTLDEEFTLRIKAQGGLRELDYFSAGTRDAAYLALRLALADIVEGERTLPLIFDDPFVNLDDARWKNLFAHLKELGKERQILLFSCRTLS